MATPEEKAALNKVMQLLEAERVESTFANPYDDQIPA